MKIVSLYSENIKRLKAVDIKPEGNTVILSGKNAQGKTSILDSIEIAMRGKAALKDTPEPIRRGEKKARIVLDIGDYVVTRRFTDTGNSYLEVVSKEGASFKSPQALLDKLYSDISFDPLEYLDMDPKKQLQILMGLVKLDVDPAVIDGKIKKHYDDRADVNKDVTRLKGVLASLPELPEGITVPDKEVSVTEITVEYEAAQAQIRRNNEVRARLADIKNQFNVAKNEISRIDEELEELRDRIADLTTQKSNWEANKTALSTSGRELSEAVAALVDPDLQAFITRMSELESVNRLVRAKADRDRIINELNRAETESESHTKAIADLQESKVEAMKRATFPVDGLGFTEDGVTFMDKPLTQASSAEQLRISLAMAASLRPELRVIHIRNGSLLDSTSMKLIEDYAAQNDLQVWVEKVDESGRLGIYIEDGEVVSIDGEKIGKEDSVNG
jgi:DNA repair exonuclease SbcCD ATPase subunit